MTRRFRLLIWIFAAFFSAAALAAITLGVAGAGTAGTDQALRVTARFSFLLFWPAYAGGVLRQFDIPLLAAFGGLRREFGLSFAAAHSVHVLLIAWLYFIGSPVSADVLIVDGIGVIWVYLLVILSIDSLRRALGSMVLRILFNLGLEYIAFVFLSDFLLSALPRGRALSIAYLPFTLLLLVGAAGRWFTAGRWLFVKLITTRSRRAGIG
jgi:hypothetical protein